jgi:hypothetical protein
MSCQTDRVRAMKASFGIACERHRARLGRATASLPCGDPRGLPARLSTSRRRGRHRECHAAGRKWAPPSPGARPHRELCPMIAGRTACRGSTAPLPRSRVREIHRRAGGGAVPSIEAGCFRRLRPPCTPMRRSPPVTPLGMAPVSPQVRSPPPGSCAAGDEVLLQIDKM